MTVSDILALTIDNLSVPQGLFIVGFASGMIRVHRADTGAPICELAAHSRMVA